MGLSHLGIFHTVIGIIAVIAALVALLKSAKIDLGKLSGKVYFWFNLGSSLTALGLSSVKGVNPGHILALVIVILILTSYYLYVKRPGKNRSRFLENFFLSLSFFLSLLPTVNETLTRVPVGNPLASGPTDPLIAKTILTLFLLFIAGSVLQFRKQRNINRLTQS